MDSSVSRIQVSETSSSPSCLSVWFPTCAAPNLNYRGKRLTFRRGWSGLSGGCSTKSLSSGTALTFQQFPPHTVGEVNQRRCAQGGRGGERKRPPKEQGGSVHLWVPSPFLAMMTDWGRGGKGLSSRKWPAQMSFTGLSQNRTHTLRTECE